MSGCDSAADGFEGDMLEGGSQTTDYELDFEQARLGKRLMFLAVVARLWKRAAMETLCGDLPAVEAAIFDEDVFEKRIPVEVQAARFVEAARVRGGGERADFCGDDI